jgi:HK97 family phage major capsid protein
MNAIARSHVAPRNLEFAAYALALLKSRGDLTAAQMVAENSNFERVRTVLKTAVEAASTTHSSYSALNVYQTLAEGFVEQLRGISVFDAILPNARRIPPRTAISVVTTLASAGRTSEATWKALSKLSIDGETLTPIKCASIMVVSDALLRLSTSAALNLLNTELLGAVRDAVDREFLVEVCDGIAPTATSGSFPTDLKTLLTAVNTKGAGRHVLVVDVFTGTYLATLPSATSADEFAYPNMTPTGGVIQGIPVFVTDNMPSLGTVGAPSLVLIEAGQLALWADAPVLAASGDATLAMDDDPSDVAQNVVSLFQTNSVAMRAERAISVKRLRDTAVAAITGYGVSP